MCDYINRFVFTRVMSVTACICILWSVFFFFIYCVFFFFFFSSRRRHTRCGRDWSSDVCSSDLNIPNNDYKTSLQVAKGAYVVSKDEGNIDVVLVANGSEVATLFEGAKLLRDKRSEERRVGKECRSRWSPDH